jgi:AraC family transcriptional regulator
MLDSFGGVSLYPNNIARRQSATWRGITADIVQVTRHEPFEYQLKAPVHLLAVLEQAVRRDGETFVEGLPLSRRREFSRTLMFVPAGHEFHGWQDPRALLRVTYFYIDPQGPLLDPDLRFGDIAFEPRLFFEESSIWETATKLKRLAERPSSGNLLYAEALSIVLAHELVRLNDGHPVVEPTARGGLAGWQKNAVAQHVAEHLAEPVSLATMAELAQLSAFHFARAFKQSFGMPPHRYHTNLRIERAKSLLAQPDLSVTEIATTLGFGETSSFSATFRKLTGRTPSDYRRSLV